MNRIISSLLVTVALTLGLTQAANATSAESAGKYVESLGNKAVGIISSEKLSKDSKQKKLEKIFSSNVDIPWVGRFVMGRYWRKATDKQKKDYLKAYEDFVVSHYAARFAEYSGGKFNITETRDAGDDEYTVSMEMLNDDNSEPVYVDYKVRNEKGRFKVFDVIVEGVSMITTQRSEFSAVIGNKGIDTLIDKLANKTLTADAAAKQ
ncbi:MAG: MlaC/ttg2D family ABC transporter substrate-binding protein [Rickettsiales bacterium]